MCGRFTLTTKTEEILREFGLGPLAEPFEVQPRYNIAPTQDVVVIANRPERRLERFRWGLIPSWAKDPSIGNRMINARAESLAEKPSFRSALAKRRCLVIADGFYEWRKEGKSRLPVHVRLKTRRPLAFAGLWDLWKGMDGPVATCTIVTVPSNAALSFHDRMPAILPPQARERWLDPAPCEAAAVQGLLVPYPAEELEVYGVSSRVNSPANEGPECIQPA